MPVANRGLEAAALAKLQNHLQGMQMILAVLPVGSDVARDLRDAIGKVAKHVPPGAFSQGVQMTDMQRQLMQQRQQGPQIAAMRAGSMAPGAMGGGQAGPQPQQPPSPAG